MGIEPAARCKISCYAYPVQAFAWGIIADYSRIVKQKFDTSTVLSASFAQDRAGQTEKSGSFIRKDYDLYIC